ncbi:hypothetical protein DNTS_027913 [Danionella cerebrum]|uniref:non-specific serine/threonine protein kinase n=1 Tax=Danionella cerebrum TaxID=2873325 RepID=A0A553PZ02_9TELE|nr:hypothetical protein DNTS_027913 [Danionella translucida]
MEQSALSTISRRDGESKQRGKPAEGAERRRRKWWRKWWKRLTACIRSDESSIDQQDPCAERKVKEAWTERDSDGAPSESITCHQQLKGQSRTIKEAWKERYSGAPIGAPSESISCLQQLKGQRRTIKEAWTESGSYGGTSSMEVFRTDESSSGLQQLDEQWRTVSKHQTESLTSDSYYKESGSIELLTFMESSSDPQQLDVEKRTVSKHQTESLTSDSYYKGSGSIELLTFMESSSDPQQLDVEKRTVSKHQTESLNSVPLYRPSCSLQPLDGSSSDEKKLGEERRPMMESRNRWSSIDYIFNHYTVGDELGRGGFGVVYSGTRLEDGLKVSTPEYCPPEFAKHGCYHGKPATVWSLGVLMFIMLFGHFPTDDELILLKNQQRLTRGFSDECWHLLSKLLDPNQESRIRLETIEDHDWFKVRALTTLIIGNVTSELKSSSYLIS